MTNILYQDACKSIQESPKRWLVTGVAGFIGSNLLEFLLQHNQEVIGLDNFATGFRRNLDQVRDLVGEKAWSRFELIEGDITDAQTCLSACHGVEVVLHQAALGSVPRSLDNPLNTNASNITGFLNMLDSARRQNVQRFVYAASSSTYGDHPGLPKVEDLIGKPLSPYAVTKYVNELYADVFAKCYGFCPIGLRYFNVFGPRQNPDGAYAAVIPKWTSSMINGQEIFINGDGETSRDFSFVQNIIQANVLAALTCKDEAIGQVYNAAAGGRTTLNHLFASIKEQLGHCGVTYSNLPIYRDFRAGDVRHSHADISKANRLLGYVPSHSLAEGLRVSMPWYVAQASSGQLA